ncbi:hypothetical protein D3C87_459040 [compost metagenome]
MPTSKHLNSLMEFSYSEPLESLIAMTLIAKREYAWLSRQFRFQPDVKAVQLAEGMTSKLSHFIKGEFNHFFSQSSTYNRLDRVLQEVFYEADIEPQTVEEWITCFNEQSEGRLTALLVKAVFEDAGADWLGNHSFLDATQDMELLYSLAAACRLEDEALHAELLEHIRFPREFKSRVLTVIHSFNEHSFMPVRDLLRQLGEESMARYKEFFANEPERAFSELVRSESNLIRKSTRVHVSYIAQVQMDFRRSRKDNKPDWLVLGARNDALFGEQDEKETVQKFLKVISDKRRLDLINLLKECDRYASELAQLMKLTPAAINYHTNLLIELSLIRIIRVDNRIYYQVDPERLALLMDLTKRVLLQ